MTFFAKSKPNRPLQDLALFKSFLSPCSIEISGFQLISFLILDIFASEFFGSPGLCGINFFLPPKILAIVFIEVFFPEPKLYILLIHLLLITLTHAFAISSTWIKSLVCFPSPTIVSGLFEINCLMNTPITAPYTFVV